MKLLFTAALVALATPAAAGTFTITNVQTDRTEIIALGTPLASPLTAYVGRLKLTTSTTDYFAWCVDLFHEVGIGSGQHLPYATGKVLTDGNGHTLTGTQRREIAGLIVHGDALLAAPGATTSDSAATQLAIWSIEYPTLTYTGASAQTTAEAVALIALAPTLPGRADALIALGGTQGFATAVPEAGSLALLFGGLGLLAWARRNRA